MRGVRGRCACEAGCARDYDAGYEEEVHVKVAGAPERDRVDEDWPRLGGAARILVVDPSHRDVEYRVLLVRGAGGRLLSREGIAIIMEEDALLPTTEGPTSKLDLTSQIVEGKVCEAAELAHHCERAQARNASQQTEQTSGA